jgi:hypothetical protein
MTHYKYHNGEPYRVQKVCRKWAPTQTGISNTQEVLLTQSGTELLRPKELIGISQREEERRPMLLEGRTENQ